MVTIKLQDGKVHLSVYYLGDRVGRNVWSLFPLSRKVQNGPPSILYSYLERSLGAVDPNLFPYLENSLCLKVEETLCQVARSRVDVLAF